MNTIDNLIVNRTDFQKQTNQTRPDGLGLYPILEAEWIDEVMQELGFSYRTTIEGRIGQYFHDSGIVGKPHTITTDVMEWLINKYKAALSAIENLRRANEKRANWERDVDPMIREEVEDNDA